MTTFKSKDRQRAVTIDPHPDGIFIGIESARAYVSAVLDPEYAPAIALDLLEAAGIDADKKHEDWLSCVEHAQRLLAEHVGVERNKAAAAAEEAARGNRRDELCREVTGEPIANFSDGWVPDLIDRIIDTENELAKERAK